MNAKEEVYKIAKDHVDMITGRHNMRILDVAEVYTVEQLRDCLDAFIAKDGSENYLMGKEENGFLVELVEVKLPNENVVQSVRFTEME